MSNSQARLIGLAILALAGAIMTQGREGDVGLAIVGVSLLAFLVQFLFSFRERQWIEDQDDYEECENCGYDLTGNVSGVCPECGTPISDNAFLDEMDDEAVSRDDSAADSRRNRPTRG